MERPPLPDETPDKQIKETSSAPCIVFEAKDDDPNKCLFAFSWIYVFRIYELVRDVETLTVKINKLHDFKLDP